MRTNPTMRTALLVILLCIIVSVVLLSDSQAQVLSKAGDGMGLKTFNELASPDRTDNQSAVDDFTVEIGEKLLDQFMNALVQEIDEDSYKVLNLSSKEELLALFSSFATEEVANKFVDVYYEERDNALYIIPTELPPWIQQGIPYERSKREEGKWLLSQQNKSELYGTYRINVLFEKRGNGWIITDISYE